MRLVNADALKKHYAWWEDDKQKLFDSIVDSQPTVDAVPVIRCYECRYYNGGISDPLRGSWCDFHEGVATDPNNYCSWAKKEGSVFGNGTNE